MSKALIVVDMQYDFVNPNGSLYVPGSENLIEPINKLVQDRISKGYEIVFTQDWHPENSQFFNSTREDGWPPHCIANTKGAEIVVNTLRDAIYIRKGTHGLFENYSAFEVPELEWILKVRGVEEIEVCGVATDYCVGQTAIQGLNLGYKVTLLLEYSKGIDSKSINAVCNRIKFLGGAVV